MNPDTGYFGVPGKEGGKVHVVSDGRPVCGTRLPAGSIFQWCASGIYKTFVECLRCRKWLKRATSQEMPE